MAGIAGFNKGLAQTADFILPDFLTPGFVQKGIDYYKNEGTRYAQQAQETNVQLGKPAEIGGQLIQGTVGAIPNAILAMMTAGTSTAAQAATQATKASSLLTTIGTVTKDLAKNPMFWTSFARTTGGTYEEAKAEGASELSAQATAIISGLLNAGVEVGGGIETLPTNLKQGGASAIRSWIDSMIDEGKEEVIQGIIENSTKKLLYDKGKKLASIQDENAILNPLRAAKEFGTGAAVGGILGGGQIGISKALTPKAPQSLVASQLVAAPQAEMQQPGATKPMPQIVSEYNGAVDKNLVGYVNMVKNNPDMKLSYQLGNVGLNAIGDINKLLGFDVSGYAQSINPDTIRHIENRHGANGAADQSMAHVEDVARIKYVLNNYDTVERRGSEKSRSFQNSDGTLAEVVLYSKRVNGNYYVVEAVPNTKAKQMRIITAYKSKAVPQASHVPAAPESVGAAATPQFSGVPAPEVTSKNAPMDTASINSSIAQKPTGVNTQYMQNGAGNAPLTPKELVEIQKRTGILQNEADKVVSKAGLTENDKIEVDRLLKGVTTLDQLPPGVNAEGIRQVYEAKKAINDLYAPVQEYNRNRKQELADEAAALIENSDNWKEKTTGLQYARETMERNFADIIKNPGEAKAITDKYITPIHKNEAQSTRMKNDLRQRVKSLDIGTQNKYQAAYTEADGTPVTGKVSESALVQLYGEGKISETGIRLSGANFEKINRSVNEFRSIYNELLDAANESLVRNGYKPVEYRKDYFPHFTDIQPDTLLGKLLQKVGIDVTGDAELPTSIAGLTETFKPGKKWVPHFLQRTTEVTTYDALQGFDRYLEGVSDVIHHTDDIQKLRVLESSLRYKYSSEGVKTEINEIRDNPTLTDEQRQKLLDEAYTRDKSKFPYLVEQLRRYTNNLAGKKSAEDRNWEHLIGRGIYKTVQNLEGRMAANMVAINPGSWLTNFIPITQGWAEVNTGNLLKGMSEAATANLRDDGFANASDFLTNRRGSDPVVKTMQDRIVETLASPFQMIDNFTAETLTRAKYHQNIEQGMSNEAAIQGADRWAASVMADRSKGSLPTMFHAKNPITKMFTMFQLEVNNQLSYAFKDIPSNQRNKGIQAVAWALTKMFLGAWLYNKAYEWITGRKAAFDPIGIIEDAYGDFSDEDKTTWQAVANAGGNVAEQMPFVGGLLGGGRLPVSSAIPNIPNVAKGVSGILSGEMPSNKAAANIGKELLKPAAYLALPFGGGQIKKTVEGIGAVNAGGSYGLNAKGQDVLQFPVENKNIGTYAKASLFGKYSLPAANEYVRSGFKTLNANETEAYRAMTSSGIFSPMAMDIIGEIKKFEPKKDANGKVIETASEQKRQYLLERKGMSPEVKQQLDKILIQSGDDKKAIDYSNEYDFRISQMDEKTQDKAKELAKSGVTSKDFVAIQKKHSEINKKYDTGSGTLAERNKQAATEFSKYIDGLTLPKKQDEAVRDKFKYWNMTPAASEQYSESTLSEGNAKLWVHPEVKEAVGNIQDFVKIQDLISEIKADKDEYGNSISGSSKDKEIAEIAKKLGVSTEKATNIHNELVTFKHSIPELSSKLQKNWQTFKALEMSEKDYLNYVNQANLIESDKDEYGNAVAGTGKDNKIQKMMEMGMDKRQAEKFINETYYFKHDISELGSKQQANWEKLKQRGMSETKYLNYLNQMSIVEGNKGANGKTISGSLKNNRYQRLLQMGMSSAQAQLFLNVAFDYKW